MIGTKDIIFDESIYYDFSKIDVIKFLKSMIKLLIEASRVQECSRIIKIKFKSDFDLKVKRKEIQFLNKKVKKIEMNNQ